MQETAKEKILAEVAESPLAPSKVFQTLENERIIAVVRSSIYENVEELTNAVMAGGIRCVLISNTVPQRFRFIETISKQYPDVLVGCAHVATGEQAQKAIEAGAKVISSPYLNKDIVNVCKNSGALVMQGAATPSEIMEAVQFDADIVQLFPINHLGGPNFIRTIKDHLPSVKFAACGGVGLDDVVDFIKAGATAVMVDDALTDRGLIREDNWKEITERAKLFTQKIATLKASK
ncbi:MAG: bifunctional 4-hydroxy-2-oxoglutarate aldolase/2-dehydro-3-deoxy-phosphogluconate aldolase [Candidatus Omnitrophica bacterium]|nr:bifunctional 4-hydroxy-2-oxoglutarate aldolase/2-dehydro-3-deoxy-phosphogluconate aldolase [Candidatus Omnitrophota bacterium]